MATLANAVENLKLNQTPIWWLYSGSTKVGQFTKSDNLQDSIDYLEQAVSLLPAGNYRLKSSDKEANHSGAVHFTFTKGSDSAPSTTTAMSTPNSTNAYGISDEKLKQLQEEIRFRLMVEGMVDDFKDFMKVWPEYKKKIDTLWADEDNDGTPDILGSLSKVSQAVEHGNKIKQSLSNAKLFG